MTTTETATTETTTTPAPHPPTPLHLPLRLPPGWRRCPPDGDGVVALGRAPRRTRTTAWVRLLVGVPDAGVGAGELEDDDEFDDDLGRAVRYRRWSPAHQPWALRESWSWGLAGTRVTLEAACDREDYPDLCDLLEDVARSVDVGACLDGRVG